MVAPAHMARAMAKVERTIFLSYRRSNVPWALAIYQHLTQSGFDVFFDFKGIASGDFERVILENIRARAHFLVLLTPSALDSCADEVDWLRREIEEAMNWGRNIVPVMLESFDFGAPAVASQLTGRLAALRSYNGLRVPADYFDAAMNKLTERFLNVPLEAVLHPASILAQRIAEEQQAAAIDAPAVQAIELTAQDWFERGYRALDPDERYRCLTNAIELNAAYVDAFNSRGALSLEQGNLSQAVQDFDRAIQLDPTSFDAYLGRGLACLARPDPHAALRDLAQAISLRSDRPEAYLHRAKAYVALEDLACAVSDFTATIERDAKSLEAFAGRGKIYRAWGHLKLAGADLAAAIALAPMDATLYFERGLVGAQQAEREGYYGERTTSLLQEADADFSEAIRLLPDRAEFYDARAANRLQQAKRLNRLQAEKRHAELLDAAEADLSEAMRLQPGHIEHLFKRAQVRERKKDFRAAINDYTTILEHQPLTAEAHYLRCLAREASGDLFGALFDCRQAIELRPDYGEAFATLSQLKGRLPPFRG